MIFSNAFFIILRRMRVPIVILIVVYTISMLGLTLIPGIDSNGKETSPMSFFHAFYFVSYTATSLGFGEVPNTFSDAQRMWVLVCMYLTVISWSYAFITLIALFTDQKFYSTLVTNNFKHKVKNFREPFYIICGCGETGSLIAHTFDYMSRAFVILEKDENRSQELLLEDFYTLPPTLNVDAALPDNLKIAGLEHPKCKGVLAVTSDEESNLAISIATRLISPKLPVIARARTPSIQANMASFGTTHIINPFARFAEHLALSISKPEQIRLIQILTSFPNTKLSNTTDNPPSGYWILCGYGRFGRAIAKRFRKAGIEITIIDPALVDAERRVVGTGTEASTLLEADIKRAVGIIAGTHDDINNLSIAVTAKELKKDLFVVARQNVASNSPLFEAFNAEITFVPGKIVAQECMAILSAPLLANFLELLKSKNEAWNKNLVYSLENLCEGFTPVIWEIKLNISEAPAAYHSLMKGMRFTLGDILIDSADRYQLLPVVTLMVSRVNGAILVPDDDLLLSAGDSLLFASSYLAKSKLQMALQMINEFNYVLTGKEEPGHLWKFLEKVYKNKRNRQMAKFLNKEIDLFHFDGFKSFMEKTKHKAKK